MLLENMLPGPDYAAKLMDGELVFDELEDVSLLFSDIKGFTPLSSKMHPGDLCQLLDILYSSFDKHLEHFGLYKVDTIGDAVVVVGGLDNYSSKQDHALKCVQCALHMLNDVKILREVVSVL